MAAIQKRSKQNRGPQNTATEHTVAEHRRQNAGHRNNRTAGRQNRRAAEHTAAERTQQNARQENTGFALLKMGRIGTVAFRPTMQGMRLAAEQQRGTVGRRETGRRPEPEHHGNGTGSGSAPEELSTKARLRVRGRRKCSSTNDGAAASGGARRGSQRSRERQKRTRDARLETTARAWRHTRRRVCQARCEGRREARKRRSGWRGRTAMLCGGAGQGGWARGRMSSGWSGCEGNLRSSRTQRAKKAAEVSSIHCSSNAEISLRRLAAWFRRESSKLSSEGFDA